MILACHATNPFIIVRTDSAHFITIIGAVTMPRTTQRGSIAIRYHPMMTPYTVQCTCTQARTYTPTNFTLSPHIRHRKYAIRLLICNGGHHRQFTATLAGLTANNYNQIKMLNYHHRPIAVPRGTRTAKPDFRERAAFNALYSRNRIVYIN